MTGRFFFFLREYLQDERLILILIGTITVNNIDTRMFHCRYTLLVFRLLSRCPSPAAPSARAAAPWAAPDELLKSLQNRAPVFS
jgi:hypothetical protein